MLALTVTCELLGTACMWDPVLDQGLNPAPLHQELGVLTTGQPGVVLLKPLQKPLEQLETITENTPHTHTWVSGQDPPEAVKGEPGFLPL